MLQPALYDPAMADTPDSPPTFETNLAQLQQIVTELEDGALGLDQSLIRFEQAIQLLRSCYEKLERAEQKIEILVGTDASGNPVLAPFDATATFDAVEKPAKKPIRRRPTSTQDETAQSPESTDTGESLF